MYIFINICIYTPTHICVFLYVYIKYICIHIKVTAGPMEYEAQENWKSLRTLSMNELMYVDENIKIMRNCGALRIYFIYEKISK
jgi:hypothetical protein